MDRVTNGWADALISQLVSSGVRLFCIAPGSRSTPLVAAVHDHPLAETVVHYDERGLAFFALGHAKAHKQPTALIVTSGSALAHLMPAVMEASALGIPLIVLTADRPPELQDAGENQTCDQHHFFGRYVRWFFSLPPGEDAQTPKLLTSVASHAISVATGARTGPVHLNCAFREPFFNDFRSGEPYPSKEHFTGKLHLSQEAVDHLLLRLQRHTNGVILAGYYEDPACTELIAILAQKMQWPVLSCISSPYRGGNGGRAHIPYYEATLKKLPFSEVTCVLQIGDRFLSKRAMQALNNAHCEEWVLLDSTLARRDQGLAVTTRVTAELRPTLQSVVEKVSRQIDDTWLTRWKYESTQAAPRIAHFFSTRHTLSEHHLMHLLSRQEGFTGVYFFGNSLSVRTAADLFYPTEKTTVYTSRGISGIDGHVATAAGIGHAHEKPLIAVFGDQTFLHDMNSLPLLLSTHAPVLCLVVNNGGGGIFAGLPIAQEKELHIPYYYNPHSYPLNEFAPLFGIPSYRIEQVEELQHHLTHFFRAPRTLFIECIIPAPAPREEFAALQNMVAKHATASI